MAIRDFLLPLHRQDKFLCHLYPKHKHYLMTLVLVGSHLGVNLQNLYPLHQKGNSAQGSVAAVQGENQNPPHDCQREIAVALHLPGLRIIGK